MRKAFSSIEVLFASILVVAAFVVAANAVTVRSSSIHFGEKLSLSEENALLLSEKLLKSCEGGLAFCSDGYVFAGRLVQQRVVLNASGFVVLRLNGENIFSQGNVSGFCVNRLALYDGNVVSLRACANG